MYRLTVSDSRGEILTSHLSPSKAWKIARFFAKRSPQVVVMLTGLCGEALFGADGSAEVEYAHACVDVPANREVSL